MVSQPGWTPHSPFKCPASTLLQRVVKQMTEESETLMPVVDVEVDTKNRKILINFWQGKEDPKPKEIVLDF